MPKSKRESSRVRRKLERLSISKPEQLSKRKIIIGYYLRSLWLTNSFVLFCLAFQIRELLGPNGVLSAEKLMEKVKFTTPSNSIYEQFLLYPTIFLFIGISDNILLLTCIIGSILSFVATIIGGTFGKITSTISAFLLLSIIVVGGDFCQFPWDFLLLEAHFIAVFLPTIKNIRNGIGATKEPSEIPLLATHFLLFRFMWAMGIEKLPFINNEKEWEELTFLRRFYETEQPLPTAASWLLTKLPMEFHKASAIFTWFVEILIPLLIFLSPKWQYVSAIFQCILMIAIHIAGNYATFQVISIVLMIPLLTDSHISKSNNTDSNAEGDEEDTTTSTSKTFLRMIFNTTCDAVLIIHGTFGVFYLIRIFEPSGLAYLGNANWLYSSNITSSIEGIENTIKQMVVNSNSTFNTTSNNDINIHVNTLIPSIALSFMKLLHPFRIVNQYGGIFHDTFDHEGHVALVFQGSADGIVWKDYTLKYSIQHEASFPQFFAPWMPRLDHAAFYEGTRVPFYFIQPSNPFYHQGNSWMLSLVNMLLNGNSNALHFFSTNPFERQNPLNRPKYVRVMARSYKFSTYDDLKNNNNWFKKISEHVHLPTVQNCGVSESACAMKNCRSVLEYYFHSDYDYVQHAFKTAMESCFVPTLSNENLNAIWQINEIDVLLATELLPLSYRRTILDWMKRRYCTINNRNNYGLEMCQAFKNNSDLIPIDLRTIAVLTESEILIDDTVKNLVKQYNIQRRRSVVQLETCLKDIYTVFQSGDVNENGLLDFEESVFIFAAAGANNPDLMATYLFEKYSDKQIRDGITFKSLLTNHRFLQEHCDQFL